MRTRWGKELHFNWKYQLQPVLAAGTDHVQLPSDWFTDHSGAYGTHGVATVHYVQNRYYPLMYVLTVSVLLKNKIDFCPGKRRFGSWPPTFLVDVPWLSSWLRMKIGYFRVPPLAFSCRALILQVIMPLYEHRIWPCKTTDQYNTAYLKLYSYTYISEIHEIFLPWNN